MARTGGGDEFAIYAPNVTQDGDVQLLANRLLEAFQRHFAWNQKMW
ncbi:hypothetical protein O9992_09865 [Vibrio lentus]|nr:hypothetical protein [Vibrio lentus]